MKALVAIPFLILGVIQFIAAVRQMRAGEHGYAKRSESPKLFWSIGLLWAAFSVYVCFMAVKIGVGLAAN